MLPGSRRHRSLLPGAGALLGGALIVHALVVAYHPLTELVGFIVLAVSVLADSYLRQRESGGH